MTLIFKKISPKPRKSFYYYWYFAWERQKVFYKKFTKKERPWTQDPIISTYRFTNSFRASDRVSQYLIGRVINDSHKDIDLFFRIILFKVFNSIETWEALEKQIGQILWETFDPKVYSDILCDRMESKKTIYSPAYIMPSPMFGLKRKHQNHLALLEFMIKSGAHEKISKANSLRQVYEIMLSYPSIGPFLAYQYTIDLNYSRLINFSENSFVVAGPGARSGIEKCFIDLGEYDLTTIIHWVHENSEKQCKSYNIPEVSLFGRKLHLIDYQNLFCEVDKYCRVAEPTLASFSNRKKIKQKYDSSTNEIEWFFPKKWEINYGMKDFVERFEWI